MCRCLPIQQGKCTSNAGMRRHFGIGPKAMTRAVGAFVRGHRQGRISGDVWQQGGYVVLGQDGQVKIHHADTGAGDRIDFTALISQVRTGRMSIWHRALDRSVVFSFDRHGFKRHARQFADNIEGRDLSAKNIMVTGCNSGIGFASVEALSAQGAMVYMACRSRERGQAAIDLIKTKNPRARLQLLEVDMADFRVSARSHRKLTAHSTVWSITPAIWSTRADTQTKTSSTSPVCMSQDRFVCRFCSRND